MTTFTPTTINAALDATLNDKNDDDDWTCGYRAGIGMFDHKVNGKTHTADRLASIVEDIALGVTRIDDFDDGTLDALGDLADHFNLHLPFLEGL